MRWQLSGWHLSGGRCLDALELYHDKECELLADEDIAIDRDIGLCKQRRGRCRGSYNQSKAGLDRRHQDLEAATPEKRERISDRIMRIFGVKKPWATEDDFDDDDERAPMLAAMQDRHSSNRVHDVIEMSDPRNGEKKQQQSPSSVSSCQISTLLQNIRSKFRVLYVSIGILLFIVLMVLFCVLVLLFAMSKMDDRYEQMLNASATHSENFMRFYEEVMHYRTSPYVTTNSIIDRLTPEQLAMAKAAGILPIQGQSNENVSEKMSPIMPNNDNLPTFFPKHNRIDEQQTTKTEGLYRQHWHDPTCNIQCKKQDVTIPPLLVISLDGFANEYLKRSIVHSLESFADCGATAEVRFHL
ncbi:ectonucleotide pyrophosphatase/phosphodiesterase C27A7.1 [Ditylenchus destructor]|uniref:Ectonucleotide pyrophosphatase/phosphodiesterase C27A7.1 n=1 Tax=Ditylenchus destructor TaxID=166010 RepID=A0AAD4NAF5_9BILA|nr:ectonucleotide pyrophosphatase/phosphodiesterase C27A7.1 [Ditylenchus destructor]